MRRYLYARLRAEEGASAVEFALVAVVLVLLLVGTVQFGYLFWQWLEITHAAREGARWAALRHPAGSVSTPWTTRYIVSSAAPSLNPRLTDADIVIVPPDPGVGDVGTPVRVTVSHDVAIFTPLMAGILGSGGAFRLSSTATMRVE